MQPMISDLSSMARPIGIELEFSLPLNSNGARSRHEDARQALADILSQNGLPSIARAYSNRLLSPGTVLAVESDSSVRPPQVTVAGERVHGIGYVDVELKTKVIDSIDEFEQIIPKAIGIIRTIGGKASPTAGFHVHLGVSEVEARPTKIRSLYNLFHRFDEVLFSLQPPSRRTGIYSVPLPDRSRLVHGCRTLPCFQRALGDLDRRHAVNFTNLWQRRPHLELRYAASTLSAEKVRCWLFTCLALVNHAMRRNCQASKEKVPGTREGLEKMLVTVGFKSCTGIYKVKDERLIAARRWLIRRWRKFNGNVPLRRNGNSSKAVDQDTRATEAS